MGYYLIYPKNKNDIVKMTTKRPTRSKYKKAGFAEGPFNNYPAVIRRLNQMNISNARRPHQVRNIRL